MANVWAIVLAAGQGSRMGASKLTLPYGPGTIISAVVSALLEAPVGGIMVVTGWHELEVRNALRGYPVDFITNPNPESGMLSSVKSGLRNLPPHVGEILIALGDQPQIHPTVIDALLNASRNSEAEMFIPTVGGKRAHPVLFRASAHESILSLPDNVGLNTWRELHRDRVALIPVELVGILHDIDTPEDYRAALRHVKGSTRQ